MRVNGIELSDMRQWEVDALSPSIQLLRACVSEIYAETERDHTPKQRKGIDKLFRAEGYLANLAPWNNRNTRTFARDKVYPVKKDEDGRRLCRWCQKPLPPHRSYCNDDCRREVDCRTNAGDLRRYVFQRDKGVCTTCGCDTEKIKRVADYAGASFRNIEHSTRLGGRGGVRGWWTVEVWAIWRAMGFNYSGHVWEADHIKEMSAGGESSLENTQTLCVPCHKAKTKKMHADRKFARTGIKPKPPVRETQIAMIDV